MQKLKQLSLIAICCLGISTLFAQDEDRFIPNYWVGAGVGINTVEIPNSIYILDPDHDYSNPTNIRVDPYKTVAGSVVLSLFKERKPKRFTSYSLRYDRSNGYTDAYLFDRDLLNDYPSDYLSTGNDALFAGIDPGSQDYSYSFIEGGIGLYRNFRFLEKWNFIYGFEYMAGYSKKFYLLADNEVRATKSVLEKRLSAGIDFSLLLTYQLSKRTLLFVKTSADILNLSTVSTTSARVIDQINPNPLPVSPPTSTQGFDLDAAIGLRMVHLGFALTLKK